MHRSTSGRQRREQRRDRRKGSGLAGKWSYSLKVQHQSGSNQQLNLSITASGAPSQDISYDGALDQDRTFTLPA